MKKTIYVVDDQNAVLEMTVMILRRLGAEWEVTGFDEPMLALQAVKAIGPSTAVMTSDTPI